MKPDVDPHVLTTVKSLLLRHIGASNRVSYDDLTTRIYGKPTDNNRRKLRAVISAINGDATNEVIICSDREDGGLFMNGSEQEDIEKHVHFAAQEESQAMSTLQKVHAYKSKINKLYGSDVLNPLPGQGRLL